VRYIIEFDINDTAKCPNALDFFYPKGYPFDTSQAFCRREFVMFQDPNTKEEQQ